jgi:hypothetical protein
MNTAKTVKIFVKRKLRLLKRTVRIYWPKIKDFIQKSIKSVSMFVKTYWPKVKLLIRRFVKYVRKNPRQTAIKGGVLLLAGGLLFLACKYIATPHPPGISKTSDKSAFYYQSSNKVFSVYIGTKKDNNPEIRFAVGSSSINFVPASARTGLSAPTLDKNKVTFKDVYQDTDYI